MTWNLVIRCFRKYTFYMKDVVMRQTISKDSLTLYRINGGATLWWTIPLYEQIEEDVRKMVQTDDNCKDLIWTVWPHRPVFTHFSEFQ